MKVSHILVSLILFGSFASTASASNPPVDPDTIRGVGRFVYPSRVTTREVQRFYRLQSPALLRRIQRQKALFDREPDFVVPAVEGPEFLELEDEFITPDMPWWERQRLINLRNRRYRGRYPQYRPYRVYR